MNLPSLKDMSLRTVALAALFLAAFSSLLPWATSSELTRIGAQTGNGRIFAIVALAGIGLTLRELSAAWMAPGFCLAIAVRAMASINNTDSFAVGFGLWVGAAMSTIAVVSLIADYLETARSRSHAGQGI